MLCVLSTVFLAFLPVDGQEQAPRPLIKEIRVEGNEITEASLVRFQSGLDINQRLQPDHPATAIRNLFSVGLFEDIKVYVEEAEGGVAVIFQVREHPRLGEVSFEGNKSINDKKLRKTAGFIRGEVLRPQARVRAEQDIREAYHEKGHNLAQVSAEVGRPDEEGRVPLIWRIKEGPKVNLKRIIFEGNASFSDGKLRKQMKKTKQDGWWFGGGKYDADLYDEDKELVLAFYRGNGYRQAEVISDSLYFDSAGRDLSIHITIDEGPLFTVGSVSWDGNENLPDFVFDEMIVSKEGDVYSTERIDKSLDQVRNAYMDIGYIGAYVSRKEESADDNIVDLHYSVIENKPWKVREVVITGNTKTKDRVIRRELWVQPGDTFQRSKIERSVRNLMQLNFFNNVEPDIETNEATSEIDLVVMVDEKQTGTASIGAGFSEQDGLVGTLGLQIPNFMGNGQLLNFQWEFGSHRETFVLGFTEPWMFNTPISLSGQLFRSTQRFFADFDQRSQGGSVRIGRRLQWPDFSNVSVGYSLSEVSFINFRDSSRIGDPALRDNVTSAVSLSFSRDSRDLPLFATTGTVFSYRPEVAGGVFGGNVNFHKHDFSTAFYFPLFWKTAISFKTTLGMVVGYGNESIPFSELYTPGGVSLFDRTMLRGYEDQSIGPLNSSRSPIGGTSQLLFNAEISIPLAQNQFYALLFADAGNAWGDHALISMLNLRRSAGFGIRIVAPMLGIMGFDFGWGFDRRDELGNRLPTQMLTHFQFGPQF
jgi:outer membrane protein insertion porin family